jgi:hypothetical protein
MSDKNLLQRINIKFCVKIDIVRLKRGGTSLREKVGFKGKQANGVGTQLMKRERQITACTALLPCYHYDVYTSPATV